MSSLVITITSDKTQTTLNDRYRLDTTRPVESVRGLGNYLIAAAGGLENASVVVQSASASPVKASGTATVAYGSLAANDTVTIAGSVLTCVTGTPTTAQYKKEVDGATTATNLAAAINAHATISQYVSASAASTVVTITAYVAGPIGNLVTTVSSSAGVVAGAAALASGAGGALNSAVVYSRGL